MPAGRARSTDPRPGFEVRLAPGARQAYDRLEDEVRSKVRTELLELAKARGTGVRLGKASKTLKGTDGDFHRLRMGNLRIMYDVPTDERVILVLGMVDRKDLERWLRNR